MVPYRIGVVCRESCSISPLVFVAADRRFVILSNRRSITAYTGGLLLVLTEVLGRREAFFEKIGWK